MKRFLLVLILTFIFNLMTTVFSYLIFPDQEVTFYDMVTLNLVIYLMYFERIPNETKVVYTAKQ